MVRQKLRNSLLFAYYPERFPARNCFRVCFWLIFADSLIFSVAFAETHPLLWDNRDTRSGWTDALTAFMYVREPSCFHYCDIASWSWRSRTVPLASSMNDLPVYTLNFVLILGPMIHFCVCG